MFAKLRLEFKEPPNFERLKGEIVTRYGRDPRPVLTYYRLGDEEYLNSIMPDHVPWKDLPPLQVQLAEIEDHYGGHLLPHIDHNISACANYYITTNDAVTHFYRLKEGGEGFVYPGREVANIFPFDQVERISRFKSNDNDLYLLDVSNIHSVEIPRPGVRKFITWQWIGVPYEKIAKTLTEQL